MLRQNKQDNPVWNEIFELEVEDLEEQKVVIILLDEGASQEFQVLGCAQFYLQVPQAMLYMGNTISSIRKAFLRCQPFAFL